MTWEESPTCAGPQSRREEGLVCRNCLTPRCFLQSVKQRFINSNAVISLIKVKICKYRTLSFSH